MLLFCCAHDGNVISKIFAWMELVDKLCQAAAYAKTNPMCETINMQYLIMQTRDSDVVVETARLNTTVHTERCILHAQSSWASFYPEFFLEAWAGFGKAKMTM